MAKDIYVDTGELSSHLLNKADDYIDTAQSKIKKVGSSPSYRGPDGYAALYTSNMMDELSSILRKLNSVESRLKKYAQLLNTGPDTLAQVDKDQKSEITTWWERTAYQYENGWLGQTTSGIVTTIVDAVEKTGDAIEYGVNAVVAKTQDIVSDVITSYEEYGTAYKAVQYGKCTISTIKGVAKIVKGAIEVATGAGIPMGLVSIVSGMNDICNVAADATYLSCGAYELVGTTNWLEDTLVENGAEFGAAVGNEDAGRLFGELVYTGFELVDLLDSADKLLTTFGTLNTDLTGVSRYSFCWGWASWDDVLETTTGELIKDSVKGTYKILKDAWKFGEHLATLGA